MEDQIPWGDLIIRIAEVGESTFGFARCIVKCLSPSVEFLKIDKLSDKFLNGIFFGLN